MKNVFLSVIFILSLVSANGQYERHIIELTDKKGTTHSIANPSTYLSAKAITRRTKQNIAIDSTDLPISAAYLDSIRNVPDVIIINVSKWLNMVHIETTNTASLDRINNFPFVKTVKEIGVARMRPTNRALKFGETIAPSTSRIQQSNNVSAISYGNAFNQIHIHEGEYLHDLGFTGRGITIAILDAGFNSYKTNPAFDSVRLDNRILGVKDFVTHDGSVNEDNTHGANCFSIIASNRPGILVGSAPHASFWLLRTENTASEYPSEEHNWAAGAEFADSVGVDMISSSLGYVDFDDPAFDHSYAERDGNTSMVTRAADMAAKKGILVMNSAGNYGLLNNDQKFVSCPADGDSVFTVGGTDVNGNIYALSSWGPNGKGDIKPNVVSVGQGTYLANTTGTPVTGNGTSYACPNLAGLVACLWQAFPDFTNMEIIDYVQRASNRYDDPHERFGYGIPNFSLAHDLLSREREARERVDVLGDKWLKAYPVPFTGSFNVIMKAPVSGNATMQLLDVMGRLIETKNIELTTNSVYVVRFTRGTGLPKGIYYVRYQDGKNRETIPVIKR